MYAIRRFTVAAICVAVAASCTGVQGATDGELQPGLIAPESGVELTVQNETTRSLRVYVLAGGFETLLGRVDPLSDSSVRLWDASTGTVSLVARATTITEGEPGHVSEPVEVQKGHRLTWVLRASPGSTGPRISYVRVFRCDEEGC